MWLNNRKVSRRKWMDNLFITASPPHMNTCQLPPGIKPDITQGRGGRAFPLKHAWSWAWACALLIMYWRGLGKLNRMFVPLNCPNLWLSFHSLDHISVPLLFLQTLSCLWFPTQKAVRDNDSQARGRNATLHKGAWCRDRQLRAMPTLFFQLWDSYNSFSK